MNELPKIIIIDDVSCLTPPDKSNINQILQRNRS
jgi:hypothetical protein